MLGSMRLGMIGLGRMGGNMVTRLAHAGVDVVGYDLHPENVQHVVDQGAQGAITPAELVEKLGEGVRAVWVMVPAGPPTESTIMALADLMKPGDIIIDGGNSYYKDSLRRAATLEARGLHFVDVGTSGGIWGLNEGYCMMVGGVESAVEALRPVFEALAPAPDRGWGRVGPSGSGHYVKMIHNGIEYGMMQAYAEGLELMHARTEFGLDMAQITEMWRYGSVVRSWLLDLTAEALSGDKDFAELSDYISDSGEGRWTVQDGLEQGIPTPVIYESVSMRLRSQQELSYAGQLISAMRRAFGGHPVRKIEQAAVVTEEPKLKAGDQPSPAEVAKGER